MKLRTMNILITIPEPDDKFAVLEFVREQVISWRGRRHPEGFDAGEIFERALVKQIASN